jgi:hypothetical protein
MTMNQKDEDFICSIAMQSSPVTKIPPAETMHHFNLSRDYTIRLLNEAIAGCDGQGIRNWNRRMRRPS